MQVEVRVSIEAAILQLKKKIAMDGLLKELRVRAYPKRSVRQRFKAGLVAKRRRQGEERRRIAEFDLTI